MANAIYDKYKEAVLSGAANIALTGDVRVIGIDSVDYTFSQVHDFLDDVPALARVFTSGALASPTVTNGVFDAADVTINGVTGDSIEALLFYIHTGVETTSRLVAYIDTGWTGLPFTPSGGNVTLQFNASGIFKI